ncbi:transposase [Sphingobacterium multivorum]|uniref:transposase n=1 Tax=Sphingobacterium multivorum TaxID=28454 RepID=UPI002FD9ECDF
MGKRPRFFDSEFKIMAVELSYAKGTAASAAKELGINESMLGKRRRDSRFNSRIDELNLRIDLNSSDTSRNLEQENKLLRKALKDATIERDILKKAISIFSKGDRNDIDL